MHPWPVGVQPIHDESISSWLIRAALNNGCDPLTLTGSFWPGWRVWTTDIDRGIPPNKLPILCDYSGIDESIFRLAELSREANLVSGNDLPKHGIWPWVQGLGVRNRKYRGGIQFCPVCFLEDEQPYFKRSWRFSWVVGCDLHGIRLVDQCNHCSAPIQPHKLDSQHSNTVSICSKCGFDLCGSEIHYINQHALNFQKSANKAVCRNEGYIGCQSIPANSWFEAHRFLINIIRRAIRCPKSSLRAAMADTGISFESVHSEQFNLQLELLSVQCREALFGYLANLAEGEFSKLAKSLEERCVSINSLCEKGCDLPNSLSFLADRLNHELHPVKKLRKNSSIKPKSKSAVLKAWLRLKRKRGIT